MLFRIFVHNFFMHAFLSLIKEPAQSWNLNTQPKDLGNRGGRNLNRGRAKDKQSSEKVSALGKWDKEFNMVLD